MDEYDVNDMEDIQNEDLPNFEPEPMPQPAELDINTPTVTVDTPVPEPGHTSTNGDYNPTTTTVGTEDEQELGSCDCRSECKYHTGKTWKYSDYGYSD